MEMNVLVFKKALSLMLSTIFMLANSTLNITDATTESFDTFFACLMATKEDTKDYDGDGLSNILEDYFGSDKNKVDTDGDGLDDYYEAVIIGTDPTKVDTDENSISDDKEDFDGDGVSNILEKRHGGDVYNIDTDGDGLKDNEEISYGTRLDKVDTDDDGLNDNIEIALGTNPLKADSDSNGVSDFDETYQIKVKAENENSDSRTEVIVNATLKGSEVSSFVVDKISENDVLFNKNIPGFLFCGYYVSVKNATLSFSINEQNINPVIYYLDDFTQEFVPLSTTFENGVASAKITKAGKYICLDKTQFTAAFSSIQLNSADMTDTDGDGLTDYQEENIIFSNGIKIKTNKNQKDSDNDSLIDSQEIKAYTVNGKIKFYQMISNPLKADSDNDGFVDSVDMTPIEPVAYKDFKTFKDVKYSGKTTMTVFVNQPFPTSRDVIDFSNLEDYDVGHTFVGVNGSDGTDFYAGFYPKKYGPYWALVRAKVVGWVKTNEGFYETDYEGLSEMKPFEDGYKERDHQWEIAKVFVTEDSVKNKLENFALNYNHRYDMVSDNCTTFSIMAFNECAGITLPIYPRIWKISPLYGIAGDIGKYVGTLTLSPSAKNSISNDWPKMIENIYRGYCPSDAGEDIRETYRNDFLENQDITLKNGDVVRAVFERKPANIISGNGISVL